MLIGLPVIGYLFGSIPWGLVLTKKFTSVDILREGSGNIGATNVRRLAGNTAGAITLAGDIAKGALPAALAVHLAGGVTWGPSLTALAAFLVAMFCEAAFDLANQQHGDQTDR